MKRILTTKSAEETLSLGTKLGALLARGDVVSLTGDLGAGKTTFVQGIALGLHSPTRVISPTFNIMRCYFDGRIPLYHIDAYRLAEGNKDIGLEEYVEGDGVAIIEWPQYIDDILPADRLTIEFINLGDDLRRLTFQANSTHYQELLKSLFEVA